MNTTETLSQMQELRLIGMHQSYRTQLELPMNQQLESHELIAQLGAPGTERLTARVAQAG